MTDLLQLRLSAGGVLVDGGVFVRELLDALADGQCFLQDIVVLNGLDSCQRCVRRRGDLVELLKNQLNSTVYCRVAHREIRLGTGCIDGSQVSIQLVNLRLHRSELVVDASRLDVNRLFSLSVGILGVTAHFLGVLAAQCCEFLLK